MRGPTSYGTGALPSTRRFLQFLLAGVAYVAISVGSDILVAADLRRVVGDMASAGHPVLAELLHFAPRIVGALPVLYVARQQKFRRFLRPAKYDTVFFAKIAVCGFILAVAANVTGLWSFGWRSQAMSAIAGTRMLIRHHSWLELTVPVILNVALIPVVEELVFRYGILRLVWRASQNYITALVVSAIVFAALHWEGSVRASVGPAILGVALGWLALSRPRTLSLVIAAHASVNAADLGMLYFAAWMSR